MTALQLSDNARRVLQVRYLRRDAAGNVIETPEDLIGRVARAVAEAELSLGSARAAAEWQERFEAMLRRLDFLPNSPTLMNAGTPLGQLSACFVLPVEDTMEGIFEALKQMALVQRSGGGTGFSFSRLRPRGETIRSTGGEASGPVSFMRIFDAATDNIKQGGKRRGANMGVLRVDHPDVLEFIDAKSGHDALVNFNLSVGATDAFMNAVKERGTYNLLHPRTRRAVGSLNAGDVFDAIVDAAWRTGDPGLVFLDTINRHNPVGALGPIEATNPCGEIPLLPFEACNLGSINLAHMLRESGDQVGIDWDKLRDTTQTALRFLDDVIEVGRYPVEAIAAVTRQNRKVGLGVMGFAEMLIRLGIGYDSPAAVHTAEDVMSSIARDARQTSQQLAAERGVFANWKKSAYQAAGIHLRNATCTAVAPTGTLSIIADTSASIEPLFALIYRHAHVLGEQVLPEVNQLFIQALEQHRLPVDRIVAQVSERGRLQDADGVPDALQRLFVTALDIPISRHLDVQAAFQRHVDNAVSKTINLPASATPDDVSQVYRRAWELGLKGVTIYRYSSKRSQVLELGSGQHPHELEHAARCDPSECKL